eukprot:12925160-Prorocentrum_lima.AAC.1
MDTYERFQEAVAAPTTSMSELMQNIAGGFDSAFRLMRFPYDLHSKVQNTNQLQRTPQWQYNDL